MSYLSHADLGGREGFGPVQPEPEDLRFHDDWERHALALTLAMGAAGAWNIDQSRSARETLPDYAQLGYYQVWLAGLEKLLAERGLVLADELAAGHLLHPPRALPRKLLAADVPAALARGSATNRPATAPPRFAPGDVVRTRTSVPDHHTRLPRYVRGQVGRIERLHGSHVFAETNAQGLGEQSQPLYTVVFDGATLWGADAAPGVTVSIDAWESTLEPAT
jgi:nitrile hydratase subunit beta